MSASASTAHALVPAAPREFSTEILKLGSRALRVGRMAGDGRSVPLLMFNGIGGNIELVAPVAAALHGREVITFDVPGVGHSQMPSRPYRLPDIVKLACQVLDHYGHDRCDVLGVSWGGAAAQQFAHSAPNRLRRLILCATAPGAVMLPARPSVLWKMATPRRLMSRSYSKRVSGQIYGGQFRQNPSLSDEIFKHVRWQSPLGYYLQVGAGLGWTSIHWLHSIRQPTLVMAGRDDPLIPMFNARVMNMLIPRSELKVLDCGHLFLLTRLDESARTIQEFLDRA